MTMRSSSALAEEMVVQAGPPAARGSAAAKLELSHAALHRRFATAFKPRPAIYWTDLAVSASIAWTAILTLLATPVLSLRALAVYVVAVLALYRAALFIHEVAHLKRGAVPGFETVWNLAVGIPFAVPSLMYSGSHADHHRRSLFATTEDPEYESIAEWGPLRIAASFAAMLAIPSVLQFRWAIAGPLSYLSRPLRCLVVERFSTLVINPGYRRRQLRDHEIRPWALQEWTLALGIWSVVAAIATGVMAPDWALKWYALTAGILMLNHARTLAAHRYANRDRTAVDRVGQLLDSVNLTGGSWLTMLAAPVGLRYHALHHLLPTLPYHSLGQVHRALVAELPEDSPYHDTFRSGILAGLRALIADAHGGHREGFVVDRRIPEPRYTSQTR